MYLRSVERREKKEKKVRESDQSPRCSAVHAPPLRLGVFSLISVPLTSFDHVDELIDVAILTESDVRVRAEEQREDRERRRQKKQTQVSDSATTNDPPHTAAVYVCSLLLHFVFLRNGGDHFIIQFC